MGISELHLYSGAPFDPRYEHSIYWGPNQLTRQTAYFDGLPGRSFADFRHIRKDSEIVINIPFDDCVTSGYNYCCVINSFPYKRWYYFITGKRYVSTNVTALQVELDVIQTYQFDWVIPACFVEREHPATDNVGEHLLAEGLELGEIVSYTGKSAIELDELAIVIQSSVECRSGVKDEEGTAIAIGSDLPGTFVDNTYSGLGLFALPNTEMGLAGMEDLLRALDTAGKTDGILSMWLYPRVMLDVEGGWPAADNVVSKVTGTLQFTWEGLGTGKLGAYTPRNKKLLSFPYRYLYLYNNSGSGAAYHYELFSDDPPQFRLGGNLANDGCIRIIPQNYRGYPSDNESGITLGGFPTCAWTQDMYKIWMAQNSASQGLAVQSGVIQSAAGVASAAFSAVTLNGAGVTAGLGMAYSGYQQIAGVMAAREDKQVQPPQAKGAQSSSTNITMGMHHFVMSECGITRDYAERIDQFFDMYGYQTNAVKVPELWSRIMWNYVKTVGCVVLGGIDAEDRRKIGAIFDKGITLWHAPDTMYRYDLAAGNVVQ